MKPYECIMYSTFEWTALLWLCKMCTWLQNYIFVCWRTESVCSHRSQVRILNQLILNPQSAAISYRMNRAQVCKASHSLHLKGWGAFKYRFKISYLFNSITWILMLLNLESDSLISDAGIWAGEFLQKCAVVFFIFILLKKYSLCDTQRNSK